MSARLPVAVLLIASQLLAGCEAIGRSRGAIDTSNEEAERLARAIQRPADGRKMDTVEIVDDVFAGDEVLRERHGEALPAALTRSSAVVFDTGEGGLTMSELTDSASAALGLPVRAEEGFGRGRVRINHRGSATALLDKIAKSSDAEWEVRGGAVRFQRWVTRSWTLYALAGGSDVHATVTSGGGSSSGSTGTGSNSGSGSDAGAVAGAVSVATSYAGELKPWADLKAAIESLIGGSGVLSLSEATGRVTVRTTPHLLEQVDDLIRNENRRHGRQVVINYAVYSISVNDSDQWGFNPSLVLSDLGKKLYSFNIHGVPISGDIGNAASLSGAVLNTATNGTLGRLAGSKLVLDALSEYGAVSLVTSNDVTALNNVPTPVNATQSISYLKQVTTNQVAQVGSSTALTPGTVTVGFVITLLPRILANGQLILRYGLTQTDLIRLRTITSSQVSIEAPEVAQRAFQQQVRMRSGDTLVLASFRQSQSSLAEQGVGTPQTVLLGGGQNGAQRRELSVIVMTPTVVPGVGMNAGASDLH
ncbi:MAG: pilus assembly protein [Rhodospirillales bacterium]|nr:pilus assembly protein [Rhodospirillales bacterium]